MKDILLTLRTDNRYSQNSLAKELGISRQAYIKYETGEVEPPVEIVRKLSKIYGVTYEFLIDNGLKKDQTISFDTSDEKILEIESPSVFYGAYNGGRNLFFENKDYFTFKTEAEKRNLSINDFIKKAVESFINFPEKSDSLNQWKPLSLGKMISDYNDKSYQSELMDGSYDWN